MKKIWYWALAVILIVGALGFWAIRSMDEPLPEGIAGPEANSLAEKVLQATGYDHWQETGAASWTFRGGYHYLWDVKRNYARISWEQNEVLMDLSTQKGIAYTNGKKLEDPSELLEKAWKRWCNDSFWFMAHHKLFDPGTVRKLVRQPDGSDALLITYMSGGVTPGDSYLWLLDDDHTPNAWKMWVGISPVGGILFSWEKWTTLATGVRVAEEHNSDAVSVPINDPKAVTSLEELTDGVDFFSPLESVVTPPQNH